MDVTFRESEPFYSKAPDLSDLVPHINSHEPESHLQATGQGQQQQQQTVVIGTIPIQIGRAHV